MMNLLLLCCFGLMSIGILQVYSWCKHLKPRKTNIHYARQPAPMESTPHPARSHSHKKTGWVKHEVLHLKAHMGKAGCRKVAMTFNRLYGGQVTVSKSTVAGIIKRNQYQLACLIREIRNKQPHPTKVNALWGLDLTFKTDPMAKQLSVLGIIDHGSRLAIHLITLLNKRSWTLLGHLCLAIGRYSKPSALRTDNEIIFNSFVFCTFLKLTSIKHQQTRVCAPWQNGRVERLFGTLKPLLAQLIIPSGVALQIALNEFALFYNHARPHQNLNGLTPAEAWQGITMADVWKSKPTLVEALGGLMLGFHMRR